MASQNKKVFVGGISQSTNEEFLREYFTKYGEIVDSVVIRDTNTGASKGFGFVTFRDSSSRDDALKNDDHVILGRKVDVKVAIRKYEMINETSANPQIEVNDQNSHTPQDKKIFVGGLPSSLTLEELKEYFQCFGTIKDGVIIYNTQTNTPRGFGFITFDTNEAVENVLRDQFHQLGNKRVEVKRATSKIQTRLVSSGGSDWGDTGAYNTHFCDNCGLLVMFVNGCWYGPQFAGATSCSIHHNDGYGCLVFPKIEDYYNYYYGRTMYEYAMSLQIEARTMW